MYSKLLSMSWHDIMESDYIFKSNFEKHVIQIYAKEITEDNNDDSIILVYYNIFTGNPIILLHHYNTSGAVNEIPDVEGYVKELTGGKDENGEEFTEVLYIDKEINQLED